jgi:hypothetical protein
MNPLTATVNRFVDFFFACFSSIPCCCICKTGFALGSLQIGGAYPPIGGRHQPPVEAEEPTYCFYLRIGRPRLFQDEECVFLELCPFLAFQGFLVFPVLVPSLCAKPVHWFLVPYPVEDWGLNSLENGSCFPLTGGD